MAVPRVALMGPCGSIRLGRGTYVKSNRFIYIFKMHAWILIKLNRNHP